VARFPSGLLLASLLAVACSDQSGVSRATKVDKVPGEPVAGSFVPSELDPEKLAEPVSLFEWGAPELLEAKDWDLAAKGKRSQRFARGHSQSFELTLEGELTPSMGPTKLERQVQPTISILGTVHAEGAADIGSRLRVQIRKVKVSGTGGDPFGLGAAAHAVLRASRLRVHLDHRGLPTAATLEIPKEIDAAHRPHLPAIHAFASGLARLFVPSPPEPAKGQSWTVRDTFVDGSALITQDTVYTVAAVDSDGGLFKLDSKVELSGVWWNKHPFESFGLQRFASGELTPPVKPDTFEFSGRGHGRLELDLAQPMSTGSQSGMIRESRSVVEEGGAKQEAGLTQELRLRYAGESGRG
jgi:hypothetical protein